MKWFLCICKVCVYCVYVTCTCALHTVKSMAVCVHVRAVYFVCPIVY